MDLKLRSCIEGITISHIFMGLLLREPFVLMSGLMLIIILYISHD